MSRPHRTTSTGIGIFVLVLVALQVFLLTVGTEALLAYDTNLAWTSAVLSVVLAVSAITLYTFFRRR